MKRRTSKHSQRSHSAAVRALRSASLVDRSFCIGLTPDQTFTASLSGDLRSFRRSGVTKKPLNTASVNTAVVMAALS